MAAFRARLAALLGAPRPRLHRAEDERRAGIAGGAEHLRPCAARRRHARGVRFARRDPARIRAPRAHRARVRRAARRRRLRGRRRDRRAGSGRRPRRPVAGDVPDRSGRARAAGHRRCGPGVGCASVARRLSFARRISGGRRRARRRFCRRRQLQVPARRSGRVLPLRRASSSRWRARHARHRLVRQGIALHLRAAGSAALCRRRRRLARVDAGRAAVLPGARRAGVHPGARRRPAARRIRSHCSGGWSRCWPSAASPRRAAPRTAAPSSWCALARRRPGQRHSMRAGS